MATTTPLQGLPVPEETDSPDPPRDITALANAVEKRLMGVYASAADRDSKITAPQEGQVAVLKDANQIHCYFDSAWTQIFPGAEPNITSGTTAPNNANGNNGDIYFQV